MGRLNGRLRLALAFLFFVSAWTGSAHADWGWSGAKFRTIYGPFKDGAEEPRAAVTTNSFSVVTTEPQYILDIQNGNTDCQSWSVWFGCGHSFGNIFGFFNDVRRTDRVDSAEIELNGRIIVSKLQINPLVDHFYLPIKLTKGTDTLTVTALGPSTAFVTLQIMAKVRPPTANIKLATPSTGTAPYLALFDTSGSTDPQGLPLTDTIEFGDGTTSTMSGLVPHLFQNPGSYSVVLKVTNSAGLSSQANISVTAIAPVVPNPPAASAPPIPSTTPITSLSQSVAFLYTGPNAVQTGVTAGAINSNQIAVIRGRVLDSNGNPLPGVQVTVPANPNLGQTFTQANGQYDIVVNGTGNVVLAYSHGGFLSVQRTIRTTLQNYAPAPDVMLSTLDPKVTVMQFGASIAQIAQGTTHTDSRGTRTATLMVPSQTTAQLMMPNGTTTPMQQLSLRLTEYTAGSNGPSRMPASLPPLSNYTYAFELSSDEGLALGAKHIEFSQPVAVYNENFLGFQAGIVVPFGLYNSTTGLWDPMPNGRVIQVLNVQNGSAVLDVLGTGNPAASADLAVLEITAEELKTIATLYQPGQSFWRVQSDHFTPGDENDLADGGFAPNDGDPNTPEDPACLNQCCPSTNFLVASNSGASSSVDNATQVAQQDVAVLGTELHLDYTTARSSGRAMERTLWSPLTAPTPPSSLIGVQFSVQVAGQYFSQSFPPTPNLQQSYTWDGKDAYGRTLTSAQIATVTVEYDFPATVRASAYDPDFTVPFFGLLNPNLGQVTIQSPVPQSYQAIFQIPLGTQTAQSDVNGWSINVHHVYDPNTQKLYFGDGRITRSLPSVNEITTIAGFGTNLPVTNPGGAIVGKDGNIYLTDTDNLKVLKIDQNGVETTIAGNGTPGYGGDGGPATQAAIFPTGAGLTQGDDLSLYFVDQGNRIRKIDPNGIISTYAGSGSRTRSGDGGPATQAGFGNISALAYSTGTLYIVDPTYPSIRSVSSQGIISPVAGNGTSGPLLSGVPANKTQFVNPQGIAVSPSGEIYVADAGSNIVSKISRSGIISNFAGNGTSGFSGDGGPATAAQLNTPTALALRPDGTLVISDSNNFRIRIVGIDGNISTFAGNGQFLTHYTDPQGDGGPAIDAELAGPDALSFAQNGSLIVADTFNHRIRRIAAILPASSPTNITIPSTNGSEIYVFSPTGQHLQTLNGLTGSPKWSFSYDAAGFLSTIMDGDGNTTSIQRDGNENPLAIVSPFGQVTNLTSDGNGNLASISNGVGSYQMTYNNGLLTQFTTATGGATTFSYDSLGNVTSAQNANGGGVQLAGTLTALGNSSTNTTALNRVSSYFRALSVTGSEETVITSSGVTTALFTNGTAVTNSLPDGEQLSTTLQGNPRLGLPSFTTAANTYQIAPTLSSVTSHTVSYVPSTTSNPFAYQQTDQFVQNGAIWTTTYDGSSRTSTSTSPTGRTGAQVIDGQGRPLMIQSGNLTPTTIVYNSHGQLASMTQGPQVTNLAYDSSGNLASITNAVGQTTGYTYDAAGRPTSTVLPDGRTIGITHDANGNITSITPPGRSAYGFANNLLDLVSGFFVPAPTGGGAAATTQYTYNADQQLASVTRPDGTQIVYSYDTATPDLLSASTPAGNYSYSYNSNNQLSSTTSSDGVTTLYSYIGHLLAGSQFSGSVVTGGAYSVSYNANLDVASDTAEGISLAYTYDADRLLIAEGPMTIVRDQNGLVTSTTLGTITDNYTYDSFGRLIGYSVGNIFSQTLTRDALGRVTQNVELFQGTTTTTSYSYDPAGRLVMVTTSDVNGNVLSTNTYTYDSNSNRIASSVGGQNVTATYDNQDRLLTYGNKTFTYNANGETTSMTDSTGTSNFTYNSFGQQTSGQWSDGTTSATLYDGQHRPAAFESNGKVIGAITYDNFGRVAGMAGNTTQRFGYGTKPFIPDIYIRNGVIHRVISDFRGTVRLVLLTSNGTVSQAINYDEFLNVTSDTSAGFQPFYSNGSIWMGTGDPHIFFSITNYRTYEADTGRWLSRDPIGFSGGDTNLYGYVLQDPINLVDRLGLQGELPFPVEPPVEGGGRPSDQGPLDPPDVNPLSCAQGQCHTEMPGPPTYEPMPPLLPKPPQPPIPGTGQCPIPGGSN